MFKLLALFALSFLMFSTSCEPDDGMDPECDATNSIFSQLYADLSTRSNYQDKVTMDTEIHAYTFTLSTTEEVCKIGYQSQPGVASTPYIMEIVDNSTASPTVIYSGSHVFSDTNTSYVTPTSTVILQAGTSYTIKRIQTNWGTNIGNTIGRLVENRQGMSFPYTYNGMTISSADFYQRGGPVPNFAVPYIDLVFR